MRVVGHAETDYLYDLVHTWHGTRIPQKQTYAPAEHRLARVDVTFRNPADSEVDEFRYDIQPYLGVKVGGTRLVDGRRRAHRLGHPLRRGHLDGGGRQTRIRSISPPDWSATRRDAPPTSSGRARSSTATEPRASGCPATGDPSM